MKLTDLSTVRELLSRYGIVMKKKFGQNFLINEAIPGKIAECGTAPGCAVLEIGPGIGTMTVELCRRAEKVVAIEIDEALWPLLDEVLSPYPNAKVLHGDVMKLDLPAVFAEQFAGYDDIRVCANLPYYITTPILMMLLESGLPLRSVTVMVQKEVADRLCALPGSAEYGAITASVCYRGIPRRCFTVQAGSFFPAPKVDSAVVRIDLYGTESPYHPQDEALLLKIMRGAFGQRRKTLCNALSTALPQIPKSEIAAAIESAGFPAAVRGEALSVADFVKIADALGVKTAACGAVIRLKND